MNKEKQKPQPKLRFPEFKDDGDWQETTLAEVADYENGKAHEQEISDTGKYKVVNSKFISTDGEVVKFTDSANLMANTGDILMVLSDIPNGKAIAKCFYVDENDTYTVNQRICKITPKDIDNKFLFYIQNRNKYFLAFDDGVKQTNLRKDTVLSFPFLKPKDPKEQEKIATCLSLLDEVINAEIQKLDLLNDHKKGLLQKLFPANGETQPKFRFPEFIDDGEWKQDELGRSLKAESSQIAKSRLSFKDSGFAVFGADGFNGFIESYSQEKDYIAVVKDGSGVGNLYYCEGKSSVLGTLNYLLSKNEEKYDTKWLYYLLNTINFKPFIKGANIPHIYFKDYSKLLVSYPKPKEQQKIAACLSAVDELIDVQEQKRERLQDHKRGLLQQLFPNLNEVAR